jgi:hypothetical protein
MEYVEEYDVFLSYSHLDKALAKRLVGALRDVGLSVWFDEDRIDDFSSITGAIDSGLSRAKAIVALYSKKYAESGPCKLEVQTAFVTALRFSKCAERILVVNTENQASHIQPIQLSDALFRSLPHDSPDESVRETAAAVATSVALLEGILAPEPTRSSSPWFYGYHPRSSNRFVGRLNELWAIHSGLWATSGKVTSGAVLPDVVQVRGMGGVGKSLLIEQYAAQFAAAYSRGVFWLNGRLDREDQTSAFLAKLQAEAKSEGDIVPANLEDALAGSRAEGRANFEGGHYLWIVDDLPACLSEGERRLWFAPTRVGKTLVSIRQRGSDATEHVVELGALSQDESMSLLTGGAAALSPEVTRAAEQIVRLLGGHAMALDLARGLSKRKGLQGVLETIQVPRERMPAIDPLEKLIASMGEKLPNGHERSIAATLLSSLVCLNNAGRDALRLAAVLAPEQIPTRLFYLVFNDGAASVPDERDGLSECFEHSMADPVTVPGDLMIVAFKVHSLVKRTMQFYDSSKSAELRERARTFLLSTLESVRDQREILSLSPYVAHARFLGEPLNDLNDARLWRCVARYESSVGSWTTAASTYERTVCALQKTTEPGSLETEAVEIELLNLRANMGDPSAEARRRERLGGSHGRILNSLEALVRVGGLEDELGALIAGARAGNAAAVMAIFDGIYGPYHRRTLVGLLNTASTATWDRNPVFARDLLALVIGKCERQQDPDNPVALSARHNLAEVLLELGDLNGARAQLERALAGKRRVLPPHHHATIASQHTLGVVLFRLDDLDGARREMEAALEDARHATEVDEREMEASRKDLEYVLRAFEVRKRPSADTP